MEGQKRGKGPAHVARKSQKVTNERGRGQEAAKCGWWQQRQQHSRIGELTHTHSNTHTQQQSRSVCMTGKWCAMKCALRGSFEDAATHATFNQLLIIVLEPSRRCHCRQSDLQLQLNCFQHTHTHTVCVWLMHMYVRREGEGGYFCSKSDCLSLLFFFLTFSLC